MDSLRPWMNWARELPDEMSRKWDAYKESLQQHADYVTQISWKDSIPVVQSFVWSSAIAVALSKASGIRPDHAFRYGMMGAVGCAVDIYLRKVIPNDLMGMQPNREEVDFSSASTVVISDFSIRPFSSENLQAPSVSPYAFELSPSASLQKDATSFMRATLRTVAIATGLHILNGLFGDTVKVQRVAFNIFAVLAVAAKSTQNRFSEGKVTPWPFV